MQGRMIVMGTREIQKNARRQAILDAARSLILDGKSKDFSMPDLADKAGVSLVTPYNLFGSKSSILLEIARQDIFERAREIEIIPCDTLAQWIADLSRTLARVYYRNRHFYRRMIVTLTAQESAEGQREVLELGYMMFEPAIARLQGQGKLLSVASARTLAKQLSHSVSGSLQHCLMERGSEDGLKNEIETGILITLAGFCTKGDRAALLERIAAIEEISA
jgi:AcrR family transcriptional regulator